MPSKNKAVIFGLSGGLALTMFYLIVSWLLMPGWQVLSVAINLLGLVYMLKSYSQVKKEIIKEHDFSSV